MKIGKKSSVNLAESGEMVMFLYSNFNGFIYSQQRFHPYIIFSEYNPSKYSPPNISLPEYKPPKSGTQIYF